MNETAEGVSKLILNAHIRRKTEQGVKSKTSATMEEFRGNKSL